MTEITLIRHAAVDAAWAGRCYGSRCDPALSPEGAAQAAILGRTIPVDAVVISSPARRARETAHQIARDFTIDPRWAERDFGRWEGLDWGVCWADAPTSATDNAASYAKYTPPDGETFDEALARVVDALEATTRTGTSVTVVTHAGPIRLALMCVGVPLDVAFMSTIAHCGHIALTWTDGKLICKRSRGLTMADVESDVHGLDQ